MRKVPESVSDAVSLPVDLVIVAVLKSSTGAEKVALPRVEELTRQVVSTRAEFIPTKARVAALKESRYKTRHEHEDLLKKVRIEAKTFEVLIIAEQDSTHSGYHGVLPSNLGTVKADYELNAVHTDVLTQLPLLFEWKEKCV